MKKSKFSEDQVVKILEEVSSGKKVREVCQAWFSTNSLQKIYSATIKMIEAAQ